MSETLPLVRGSSSSSTTISDGGSFRWDGVSVTLNAYSSYWNNATELWNQRSEQRQFGKADEVSKMIRTFSVGVEAIFWLGAILMLAYANGAIQTDNIYWIVIASLFLTVLGISCLIHIWNFFVLIRTGGASKLWHGGCTYLVVPFEKVIERNNEPWVRTFRFSATGTIENRAELTTDDCELVLRLRTQYHISISTITLYGQVIGQAYIRRLGRIWKQCLGQLTVSALFLTFLAFTVQRFSVGEDLNGDKVTHSTILTFSTQSTLTTLQ